MNDSHSYLPSLSLPCDLKKLNKEELPLVAAEIRKRIIEVMSVNGGHLASNLGTVELTLALHYIFNAPKDKFIWDVSHQTYTHKILTNRNHAFHTIRTFEGLCGFSHPKESPFDHFHAGHAGTALSLGLGLAKRRDLMGDTHLEEYIIPIIGDASLTCGVSLEALNNVPKDLKKFVVILNDNAMSISKNVGCITHILSRFINNPFIDKIQHGVNEWLSKIPSVGITLSKQTQKFAESLKNLVSPAVFFEQYGLSYIGPIDGHDLPSLLSTFEKIKNAEWPVIVHVLTQKGQGMEEAINNPTSYHGAKPFDKETGKFLTAPSKPTFPKVFGEHLVEMGEKDPHLVVITPAMSAGSCLDAFMEKFPERGIDVGIAESHAVTFAGALAYKQEKNVILSIYATFLQRGLDNLFHDVCLQESPVLFAIDRAGLSGPDGATHHGIYDISFLNAMPHMVITQPRNGTVLKELLNVAFSWGKPVAIRYPNQSTESFLPIQTRVLGKGEVLSFGADYLCIALGHMNEVALEVQKLLLPYGVRLTVLDPVFIKPLDEALLSHLLSSHTKVITLEEHALSSGFGSIIDHFLFKSGYHHVDRLHLGIEDFFIDHGSYASLMDVLNLTPKKIVKKMVSHFNLILEEVLQNN